MSDVIQNEQDILNRAVKDGGSYAVIKKRLESEGSELLNSVKDLNQKRQMEFGGTSNEIIGKINLRTENNAIPVDMCQANGHILLGYDVYMGMKTNVEINDIFSLYKVEQLDDDFKVTEVSLIDSFIDDDRFKKSISELFKYYKNAKITQITKKKNNIYIAFKIGSNVTDLKVYKFEIKKDGEIIYLDDNGSKELSLPQAHNFNWIQSSRDNFVDGKNPHVSIMDKIFVETVGGDLTIKLENNTDSGMGIYAEPVEDKNQSLEDGKYFYAEIGSLILLKILPYRESNYRYFVFNALTEKVVRIDAIGQSCIQLPENHGITFPNGYYLENGDYKIFEKESENLTYFQTMISPNGEDYMYIYYDPISSFYTIYSYNIIKKELANPIHAHGYSLYENGNFFVFRHSENNEATKVHPLRIWKTPFCSDEYFYNLSKEKTPTFLSNIGNAELVRGISDLYSVINYINKNEVTTSLYEGLIKTSKKCLDDYHWLSNENVGKINLKIEKIISTCELVIDEFEKVKNIQKQATEAITKAEKDQKLIVSQSKLVSDTSIAENVEVLSKIKSQMGHLISIKEQRYIDVEKVISLQKEIEETKSYVNEKLLNVLQKEQSFSHYFEAIQKIESELEKTVKVVDIEPLEIETLKVNEEIDLINNEVNEIEVKDATITTTILDKVSEIFSKLNQLKSKIKNKKKSFRSSEAKTEFSSQFKLLTQSIASALSKSETPDNCDAELSRLMGQVESLESKFADFDEYLAEISQKRNDIQDLFEGHKLQLVNELQKKTANIEKAANMALKNISKKVEGFDSVDALNSYFASDAIILKVYQYIEQIRGLNDIVRADELDGKLKKIKDQSLRSLRDNKDIFEDGGKIMKMGKHRFTVSKNDFDLTILPVDDDLFFHLIGTDFYEKIENEEMNSLRDYWGIDISSESKNIYRSEYLAYSVLTDAEKGVNGLNIKNLIESLKEEQLEKIVQNYSSDKYKEGYIKGIHDHDAALILKSVLNVYSKAGLLKYNQKIRAYAIMHYANKLNISEFEKFEKVIKQYGVAKSLSKELGNYSQEDKIIKENMIDSMEIEDFVDDLFRYEMSKYFLELMIENKSNLDIMNIEVDITSDAYKLVNDFKDFLVKTNIELENKFTLENYSVVKDWITSFVKMKGKEGQEFFIEEASMIYLENKKIKYQEKGLTLTSKVEGLLGEHGLISEQSLIVSLDDLILRGKHQKEIVVPNYLRYIKLRQELSNSQREKLQLESFKAKPLSSFVRNKLITESYLHLIGDNFAKQIGTAGNNKRTDLMGMLLLISPPGYGKTTIVEYVAKKLGLIFMKINCPSLNHEVVSLSPNQTSDDTAKKELEKLNLAFEMGNNVLLYLDDIQHTNPEFLQKFISLCDGTRKIEGVWNGRPKTYDLKGKKFAVVMAGNPYTETGEAFKIPDMLANRADIYNLGDQLSNQQGIFELSYIENSLTSNSVISPLANRNLDDLYKMVDMAKGKNVPINELEHNYSTSEVNEIVSVIKKMIMIQEVVLMVNKQYILSASMEDKYRDEPPFRLQGSYRNMNKMVEKIVPAMNDDEVMAIILDHYKGESQTLTVGAEDNYLKLKIMLGIASESEKNRYGDILNDFRRHKLVGDNDTDGTVKIANQIGNLNESLEKVFSSVENKDNSNEIKKLIPLLEKIMENNDKKDKPVIDLLTSLNTFISRRNKKG